ncbi:hypothetical protein [Kribbella sp. CA-293567]|uniref:hypothetical protein n=1 Tax=Kribbella sp. CA-293567 TaxID=3002436 RepID=UPI0022DD36C1|nr:hypothetical protein [Kribbella sp. CA-293567]WBQ05976.1 hypothetical protein OX958_04040 [Kribbella sp. CA-293567]
MNKTKLIRIMTAAAVVGTGLVGGVGAGTASAAPNCNQYGPLRDGRTLQSIGSIPYKAGPAAECPTYRSLEGRAVIHCQKKNTYGNIWFFVRHQATGQTGWIYKGDTTLYPDGIKWCNP